MTHVSTGQAQSYINENGHFVVANIERSEDNGVNVELDQARSWRAGMAFDYDDGLAVPATAVFNARTDEEASQTRPPAVITSGDVLYNSSVYSRGVNPARAAENSGR
jgi:hypothetical protein